MIRKRTYGYRDGRLTMIESTIEMTLHFSRECDGGAWFDSDGDECSNYPEVLFLRGEEWQALGFKKTLNVTVTMPNAVFT